MTVPRSIDVDGQVFCIVNEVESGNTVNIDAVGPDQIPVNIAVLKTAASDLAIGRILVAAWQESRATKRAPL